MRITSIASLDVLDVADPEPGDSAAWSSIRHDLGIAGFGVTAWIGRDVGDHVIDDHDEADSGHEELYVVMRGRARFVVGDEEADAPAGTLIAVEPELPRRAFALEPDTLVLVVGAKPGEAFTPSDWELRDLRAAGKL